MRLNVSILSKVIHNLFGKVTSSGKCKKSCTTLQYSGKVLYERLWDENGMKVSFRYKTPEDTTVFEEYLVYDTIGVIGAVGGTLGMCIGFSFTNLTHFVMMCIQTVINFVKKEPMKKGEEISAQDDLVTNNPKNGFLFDDQISRIEAKLDMLERLCATNETHCK